MDELSQVQEDGFFEDVTEADLVDDKPTETNETNTSNAEVKTEANEAPTEVPTNEVPNEVPTSFLDITYNKEVKSLTKDEAKDLAEKGMNYDKMRDKYNYLNGELTRLAQSEGLSIEDYLHVLGDARIENLENKELESLKTKYPDANEELLGELAHQNVANRLNLQNQQVAEQKKGEDDALNAEVIRQTEMFKREYPNLDPNGLDRKVYDFVREGYTLTEAYGRWVREDMAKNKSAEEAKARVNELNQANKAQSIGNTTNVATAEKDSFLEGWDEF